MATGTSAQGEAPSKRALQREETRQRIIESAAECFAERGFEGSSTREIAARAGTNQGLITYHFKSKELLWKAAADHVFGGVRRELDEGRARIEGINDPRERARASIRGFVRYSALHPEISRLMIEEGKTEDERMVWLVDRYVRTMYETFCEYGVEFREPEGMVLGDELLPHAFYAMVGAASVIFMVVPECEVMTGLNPTASEAIERHADYVARLFVP